MKKIVNYILIFAFVITSCNNEEITDPGEAIEGNTEVSEETPEDETPEIEIESCVISDFNIQENEVTTINCLLDLEGQTINVPTGVTFKFDGGDVFNGTLNFSSAGLIDGELLNSKLTLEGDVKLTSETFNFATNRWDIVEGRVSDEIARNNRDLLENLFLTIKDLEANTFVIDALDAYFKVDGFLNEAVPENQAVNLPSDFNLKMSENTHLRMQPNGHFRANLLAVYNESNITLSGGTLHGDREEHDYNSGFVDSDGNDGPTNEWVNTMGIKGGQNIVIDGVTFMDAAGDGITISGLNHYHQDNHVKSTNITIKNSNFLRARRTNIVITSGDYIYIENNRIEDGGIDMDNSTGTAPSSNLNIEPLLGNLTDSEGNKLINQKVNNVYIKKNTQIVNNKEANLGAGNFQLSHGSVIIVEDNTMINTGISFFTTHDVEIKNNTITEGGITAGAGENIDREDAVYGNIVSNNKVITSTGTAINVSGNGSVITENHFEGVVGVAFGSGAKQTTDGASNIIFSDNTIQGSSRGITSLNTMKNVRIENNEIHMLSSAPFALTLQNEWEDSSNAADFVFKGNKVTGEQEGTERGSPANGINSNSITIENNIMGELQFFSCENINILNNDIEAEIGHNGILINGEITNSIFDANKITIYPSKTTLTVNCVKVKDGITIPASTTISNQECNEE